MASVNWGYVAIGSSAVALVLTGICAVVVTGRRRSLRRPIGFGLTTVAVIATAAVAIVTLARTGASATTTHAQPSRNASAHIIRTSRLDAMGWETVRNAIHLRAMALTPGRTAYYRVFAAYMALSGLIRLHPVLPGRCATAVSYLYDNLLDLHDAYPGEDWQPLRRLIAKQPSLDVCAPRASQRLTYVG
jgi:hypothetical protein